MRTFAILALLCALASCSTGKQAIHYTGYRCDCSYPDGFGPDKHTQIRDTGTVTVRKGSIVRRAGGAVTVLKGDCTYQYKVN